MNIDFDKSHPAMNMDDKRGAYQGFVRVSIVSIVLIAILMVGLLIFRT